MQRRSFLKYLGMGAAAAPLIPLVGRLTGPAPATAPFHSRNTVARAEALSRGRGWWVDAQAFPFDHGDGSVENPFHTMQEAIDAATSSDYIIMTPGEYAWVDERGIFLET